MIRLEVQRLRAMGALPSEQQASVEQLKAYQDLLQAIKAPVTDEEAGELVGLFAGPDTCFGLAWTVLHLVESAPGWPIASCLFGKSEWLQTLRDRAGRGGKLP